MWAVVDGVKENVIFPIALSMFPSQNSSLKILFIFQVGNFGVEPPRLFRGRGEHLKVISQIVPRLSCTYYETYDPSRDEETTCEDAALTRENFEERGSLEDASPLYPS
ncbi:hypothetical protein Bca101_060400 [Brassica carinata]